MALSSIFDPLLLVGSITLVGLPSYYNTVGCPVINISRRWGQERHQAAIMAHREAWIAEADKVVGPGGDHGGSEAHWAASAGDVDSLRELEPHLLETTDDYSMTPAHWGAIGNRVAALQYLQRWYQGLWRPRIKMAARRPTTQQRRKRQCGSVRVLEQAGIRGSRGQGSKWPDTGPQRSRKRQCGSVRVLEQAGTRGSRGQE